MSSWAEAALSRAALRVGQDLDGPAREAALGALVELSPVAPALERLGAAGLRRLGAQLALSSPKATGSVVGATRGEQLLAELRQANREHYAQLQEEQDLREVLDAVKSAGLKALQIAIMFLVSAI